METGCCGASSSPKPCAEANSNTDKTTIDDTTSMIAEKRSTTSEIAMGASQPPSKTASAPPLIQTSTNSQISRAMVRTIVASVTIIWLIGRRTSVKAMAAPKMGSSTDNGASETTEKSFTDGHLLSDRAAGRWAHLALLIHNQYLGPHGPRGIPIPLLSALRHLRHHRPAVRQPEYLRCPPGLHRDEPEPRTDKSRPAGRL